MAAQLFNQGGHVTVQAGALVYSATVTNANGGLVDNQGALVATEALFNTGASVLQGDGHYAIGQNWANTANFLAGLSAVLFNGSNNGQIHSGGAPFNDVEVNKAPHAYEALADPMQIAGTLRFTGPGAIALGDHSLTVNTVEGAGPGRFVATNGSGMLTKHLSGTSFVFPVGHGSGFDGGAAVLGRFAPVIVTCPTPVQQEIFQVAYYGTDPDQAVYPAGAPFSRSALQGLCAVSALEYWDVNGAVPVRLTFAWEAASRVGDLTGQLSNLRVAGWNGTRWVDLGIPAAVSGDLVAGSITTPLVVPDQYEVFALAATTTPPVFTTCSANIARNTALGQCGAFVTYNTPVFASNCSGAVLEQVEGQASGTFFPKGENRVTWEVTDAIGQTALCQFTVSVFDNEAPTLACPTNIVRGTDPGRCEAVVSYTDPNASDNCVVALLERTNGLPSASAFAVGAHPIQWRATDGAGNTRTCAFSIVVNDVQAPNLACPPNQVRSTDVGQCSAQVQYPTPVANDNCALPLGQPQWVVGGSAPVANGSGNVASFNKGVTTVQWRVTDGAGLTRTCTFRVIVNDVEAPVLVCPVPSTVVAAAGQCSAVVTYGVPAFSDNCAPFGGTAVRVGGPSNGATVGVGSHLVVFQATDASGNTRRCSVSIAVLDGQAPVISCPPSVTVAGSGVPCTATVFYQTPAASDNCGGILTPFLVSGAASGSAFPQGISVNVWQAVDPSGQSATCSFSIAVACGGSAPLIQPPLVLRADFPLPKRLWIAPNPAAQVAWLDISEYPNQALKIGLLNSLGVLVQAYDIPSTAYRRVPLDLANLPRGFYVVWVQPKGEVGSGVKLMVE